MKPISRATDTWRMSKRMASTRQEARPPSPNHTPMTHERPSQFAISDIPAHLDDGAWFHGSPETLSLLATGSTMTRSRLVAEAFSHRPTCVGIDDSGDRIEVCHNGRQAGFLYAIDEPVGEDDVRPHPNSSFRGGGLEWLTTRPLRLRKIADLPLADPPCTPDCPRRPPPQ